MAYKLPTIDLKKLAQQKKEGLLKGSSTPTNNILSGSPISNRKPETLLTLKQPLSDKVVSNLSKIQGTSNATMGNPEVKQVQSSYVPLTKEQFQKARAAGFTPEKIIEMEKKRKEQSQPKKTVSEKIDKFGADLTATGISGAIRGTGNILGTGIKGVGWVGEKIGQGLDFVTPGDQSGFGKGVREMGKNIGERVKIGAEETAKDFEALQGRMSKQGPINQDSAAAKIGGFIGETIPAVYSGGGVAKGIIGTSSKLLPKIARGGIEGYAFDVASGSETPGVGTISGAILPGVGAGISKLGGELGLKGLLKFGAKKKVAKQIADEVGDSASKIDIYKWMKDRGITKKFADEDAMATRLYEHSKQAKNAVDDITKSLSEKGAKVKADQNVLGGLAKVIEKKGGSQSAEEIVKLNRANALLSKANKTGNLTLQEANEAKRLIDDSLDLYTFQGDVRMKNIDNANLRAGIRKSIEDTAKKFGVNIRDYNKEISIARTLADGITDKQMSNELVDRLWDFGMKTASRGVIGNIIAPFGHETKTDYLLNGIAGFVIGGSVNKAVGNRRLVNFASNVMTSFSGAEKNIIKEYFKNKKMTPQAEKVIVKLADKMDDAYKQLPPGEQKLLLSPPKGELTAPKGTALPMPKVPEGASYPKTDIIAESNRGINFGNVKTTVPETLALPKAQSTNSILKQATKPQAEVSKVGGEIASKEVNTPIIQKIAKKQETPKTMPKKIDEVKTSKPLVNETDSLVIKSSGDVNLKPKPLVNEGLDIETTLKEFQEKSDKFKDVYVARITIDNPTKAIVKDYTRVGRTEWYTKQEGNTIQAIRSDGVGFKVTTKDNAIEKTIARDFLDTVIDKNKYLPERKLGEIVENAIETTPSNLPKKIALPKEGGKSVEDIAKMLKDKPKKPARMVELEKKIQDYIDEFKKLDSDLGTSEAKNKMMPDGKPNPEYIKARDELLEYRWFEDSKGNVTRKFYSDDTPEQIREHQLWMKNNTKKPSLPLSQRTPVVYSKVDDLASEARKYKSAEEFIKAQGDSILLDTSNPVVKSIVNGKTKNISFEGTKFDVADIPEGNHHIGKVKDIIKDKFALSQLDDATRNIDVVIIRNNNTSQLDMGKFNPSENQNTFPYRGDYSKGIIVDKGMDFLKGKPTIILNADSFAVNKNSLFETIMHEAIHGQRSLKGRKMVGEVIEKSADNFEKYIMSKSKQQLIDIYNKYNKIKG